MDPAKEAQFKELMKDRFWSWRDPKSLQMLLDFFARKIGRDLPARPKFTTSHVLCVGGNVWPCRKVVLPNCYIRLTFVGFRAE